MKNKTLLLISATLAIIAAAIVLSLSKGSTYTHPAQSRLLLDMVHHNPGEPLYKSQYNDPNTLQEMGYNGKVYFLFESPMLATNWESVDPTILPEGSDDRAWIDAKAELITSHLESCKEIGFSTWAMSDLILFPKKVVEKYNLDDDFGDPRNPLVEKLLRAQIAEMFDQFPDLDGLVVRIGETYLHDAPYHIGHIRDKRNMEETVIPLMQILREEVCVNRNKGVIFRTWMSFDSVLEDYLKVSDAVEPHPNLVIGIKQCEGDFHRANNFSKVIGEGRHRQIIEVQCAREYEGKGAYPNYIAHGVIEGFEEHQTMPEERIKSLREFAEKRPDIYAGVWTWTRGGGWGGPYISNEMWCDLNAWVMIQWGADPSQSEEAIFNRYATEKLHLKGDDVAKFRRLALLSADAVIRGRNTVEGDMSPWWTRDQGISTPALNDESVARVKAQKDESIEMWQEIIDLAESIEWADDETRDHVVSSSYYGLHLYEIYRSVIYLVDAERVGNAKELQRWIKVYDEAWAKYNALPSRYPNISTLYTQDYTRHIKSPIDIKVNSLRAR